MHIKITTSIQSPSYWRLTLAGLSAFVWILSASEFVSGHIDRAIYFALGAIFCAINDRG